ncbi:MAG: FliM/FliN family flagellar motor C-terminal domain-containing protein [Gammaproteobacteria bacterium]|jgi:flagellar motor switch/type III secretory pathway protein FliN
MNGSNTGEGQSPAVLAQAFPQLGNGSSEAGAAGSRSGEHTLKAVPAPAPVPAQSMAVAKSESTAGLERFWNVPVTLRFEVSYQSITVQQLMSLTRGSIVPLQDVYVDSIKVKVEDRTIARAEAVSLKKRYGMRVSEISVPNGTRSR